MRLSITLGSAGIAALLSACGPGGERPYAEGDTPTAAPATTPTLDVPPDSTTGVARSSGRPGVAGEKVSRGSDISAPPGKAPAPSRP